MSDGLYVGLSAQISLEQRLATLADNVANANTPGFRAANIRFETLLSRASGSETAFVSSGAEYFSPAQGEMKSTGNPLDFAVAGDAWFAVATPAGTVMTRDGRFTMDASGALVSLDGDPVQDPGGAPIQLNPSGGAPVSGADGILRQDGRVVGSIGLFSFAPGPSSVRHGPSGFVAAQSPEPMIDRTDTTVMQGYVEGSNVSAVAELVRLITVQRSFESASALISERESALSQTVRAMEMR